MYRERHRILLRIALAGAHVFAWIFLFQLFYLQSSSVANALGSTVLTYALTQAIAVLLTPWSGSMIRHGIRRSLVLASLSAAGAFAVLAAGFSGTFGAVAWSVGLFAVLMGMYRAMYWIPYEVDREGTAVSRASEYLLAFVPAIAGIALAAEMPFVLLLGIASALALLSIVPLLYTPERHEGFAWGYRESFHELFSPANRTMLIRALCDGIEGAALLLVWPIVVFLLLDWSYGLLGIILTITLLATMFVRANMKRLGLVEIPTLALAALAGSAWLMRLIVATPLGIVLVDTYFHTGKPVSRGIDAAVHEQAAENRTYIDEYTALKEMGMGIGRVMLCVLVAVFASDSFTAAAFGAFVIAAIAAITSIVIARSR